MAQPDTGPDSLENLAFQLILQKLVSLERAMQSIPPLLTKIVDQLEAQTRQPEVPIATYAQLYPELPQDAAADEQPQAPETLEERAAPQGGKSQRFWRWFLREG